MGCWWLSAKKPQPGNRRQVYLAWYGQVITCQPANWLSIGKGRRIVKQARFRYRLVYENFLGATHCKGEAFRTIGQPVARLYKGMLHPYKMTSKSR